MSTDSNKRKTSTSIVDSILKKNKQHGKKLIIDLDENTHLITNSNITPTERTFNSSPTIIIDKAKPKSPDINPETKQKLDIMFEIDNAITAINNTILPQQPPVPLAPAINIIQEQRGKESLTTNITDNISDTKHREYTNELKHIEEQLVTVKHKIARKGPEQKYLDIQHKLEQRRDKYLKRLKVGGHINIYASTNVNTDVTKNNNNAKHVSKTNTHFEYPQQNTIQDNMYTNANPGTIRTERVISSTLKQDILQDINKEINNARTLLSTIDNNNKQTNQIIREPGISIFAVPNELNSIKEKKAHLIAEQKKFAERLTHRQKQIDKIKNWQRELERYTELQKEREKLHQLHIDLKNLERQQYEQDRNLKKQIYEYRRSAHNKTQQLKQFEAKNYNDTVRRVHEAGMSSGNKPNIIIPTDDTLFTKLKKQLLGLAIGEKVIFSQKHKIANGTENTTTKVSPGLGGINIAEDSKTGLTFFTEPAGPVPFSLSETSVSRHSSSDISLLKESIPGPVESNAVLAGTISGPVESNAGLAGTISGPVESNAGLAGTISGPAEINPVRYDEKCLPFSLSETLVPSHSNNGVSMVGNSHDIPTMKTNISTVYDIKPINLDNLLNIATAKLTSRIEKMNCKHDLINLLSNNDGCQIICSY